MTLPHKLDEIVEGMTATEVFRAWMESVVENPGSATSAQFADIDSEINANNKYAYKMVPNSTTGLIMTALGPDPGDDWQPSDGGSAVTPS